MAGAGAREHRAGPIPPAPVGEVLRHGDSAKMLRSLSSEGLTQCGTRMTRTQGQLGALSMSPALL